MRVTSLNPLWASVHTKFSVDEQIRVLTTEKLDKTFQLLFTNIKHALSELLIKNKQAFMKPLNNDMSIVRHCRWRVGLRWAGGCKAWFSLTHKHMHKDIRTRRRAYLTQFSIPALLKPMINKMANEASAILLLICSHEVWVKVTYDWSTTLCLCLCLCRFH